MCVEEKIKFGYKCDIILVFEKQSLKNCHLVFTRVSRKGGGGTDLATYLIIRPTADMLPQITPINLKSKRILNLFLFDN